MLKCNDDSGSEDGQINPMLQRSLVVESMIEVDHLICSICHHLVWDPVTCGSENGCHNAFCRDCIDAWVQKCYSNDPNNQLCPQCKRPFKQGKILPIMRSVLDGLIIRCPNHIHGCQSQAKYFDLPGHIMQCKFRVRRCRGCLANILISEYEQHTNQCQKYLIDCAFCGQTMSKPTYIAEHATTEDNGKVERSFNCYIKQIDTLGCRVESLDHNISLLTRQCERIENLTQSFSLQPIHQNRGMRVE